MRATSPNLLENNGMERIAPTEGRPLAVRWRYTGCPLAYTRNPVRAFFQPLQVAAARSPGSSISKASRYARWDSASPSLASVRGRFHGRSRKRPGRMLKCGVSNPYLNLCPDTFPVPDGRGRPGRRYSGRPHQSRFSEPAALPPMRGVAPELRISHVPGSLAGISAFRSLACVRGLSTAAAGNSPGRAT